MNFSPTDPTQGSAPNSFRCNGELVRFYRQQLGWTQLDLANRAGCSERTVRKIEKGDPIRRETVAALATALSTPAQPLTADDLTTDPLAVAQAFMRAYFRYRENTGRECPHLFHPQILMVVHTASDALGFGGTFVGPEGIDRMIREAYSRVVPVEEEFGRWYVTGSRVAVMRRQWLCPANDLTGPRTEVWILHEYAVEAGLITRVDTYFDSQAYERATFYTRDRSESPEPSGTDHPG